MKKTAVLFVTFVLLFSMMPVNAASNTKYKSTRRPVAVTQLVKVKQPVAETVKTVKPATETVTTVQPTTETVTTVQPTTETVTTVQPTTEPVSTVQPIEQPVAQPTNSVSVLDFGAKGDGTTDDTAAIQKALNQNDNIYIPDGTYLINVDSSLNAKANQKITLSSNAVLKALSTSNGTYELINVDGVNNVTISGGTLVGERNNHQGTSGEWGMGIKIINGSSNIVINNMTISDFWGDGIYLGGSTSVSGITIDNVLCDKNRRQGISVTNAKNVTISNSILRNTSGTAPQAGIDIEPNENETAQDIKIVNTQCYGNSGSGINFMGITGTIQRVDVQDCTAKDNGDYGIELVKASDLTFNNISVTNNYFGIEFARDVFNVTLNNMNISNNKNRGVSLVSSGQSVGIENIVFTNSTIANNSQAAPGATDGIRIDQYDSSGYIKNIQFKNTKFIDNQAPATQRYGMTVASTETITGIVLASDCSFSGNVSGDKIVSSAVVFGN